MKKFVSEIFKLNRSGKLDAEEASHSELCVKPKIQDKYKLTPKTSPVYHADMLLPLKNICRVRNKCRPLINWHIGKIMNA